MDIDKAIQSAHEHHLAGNLEQAEDIYRKILNVQPDNYELYNDLGNLLQEKGTPDQAAASYRKAIELNPDFAGAYYNLGETLQDEGLLDEAADCYKKVIELYPDFAGAYYNLGVILHEKKDFDEALKYYEKVLQFNPRHAKTVDGIGTILQETGKVDESISYYNKAIELAPDFAKAYFDLGYVLQEKGRLDEAVTYYEKAIHLDPTMVDAYNNLGLAFQEKGFLDKAAACYQEALQIKPDFVDANNNLADILTIKHRFDEAINHYQKSLEIDPNFSITYHNLGIALRDTGKLNEALNAFDMAINAEPGNVRSRWARCISYLPVIYSDESEIEVSRSRYQSELRSLEESISLQNDEEIEAANKAVGSIQPFYLAYQGRNDKQLQQFYGSLVSRIMSKKYPEFSSLHSVPSLSYGEPMRIGIVSRFFYYHPVWKILTRGWMENLNADRFKLYGYHTGRKKDAETDLARRYCRRFVEDIYSFEELCRIVQGDSLHVLVYPEIGMDSVTLRLASLRLAPVQCASWGHPDTTGLPTVDYYLSSDLMEPPDAGDHYTEQLVRLPNLSVFYTPLNASDSGIKRDACGLRHDSVVYHCCQSLFKFLPQCDEVFPRIAQRVGNCQFLFASYPDISSVLERFRSRVGGTFKRFGLNPEDHIVFLPFVEVAQYQAINGISDILLDPVGWSGCTTALEAIDFNLPVVTLPGLMQRGRAAAAILTMMGMTETIADNLDDYINIAARLGLDSEWRKQITEKIASNKHRVYRDKDCIIGLEEFFEKTADRETKK
jgi:protein O-GlcNAc transferase